MDGEFGWEGQRRRALSTRDFGWASWGANILGRYKDGAAVLRIGIAACKGAAGTGKLAAIADGNLRTNGKNAGLMIGQYKCAKI
jgi:hypothetical protein